MFWNYFKNVLKFALILKGGAFTVVAKAIADCFDRAYDAIIWLRDQFMPSTCEDQYLDQYGQSRGLTRAPAESDKMWRKRVIYAAAWHKLAGHFKGLAQIFSLSGYPGTKIRELKDDKWAEFDLVVPAPENMTDSTWDHLIWLANEYKRATSKLKSVIIELTATGKVTIKAAQMSGEICTVYPLNVTEVEQTSKVYPGAAFMPGLEIVTITPLAEH